VVRSLFLQNSNGCAFNASVEDDHLDRFGPMVRAVVPFVNHFDHGVARFDVEDFAFARGDRELAPEDDGRVDDRMLVQGQTLARRDRDFQHGDLGLARGINRKFLARPGFSRDGEFFLRGSRFVFGEKSQRKKKQEENGEGCCFHRS
jgi:hypothetical protein